MFQDAKCAGMDTKIFYPDAKDHRGRRAAEAICKECPAQLECLKMAIDTKEEAGIWGGASPGERDYIRRYKVTLADYVAIKCGTEAGYYRHRRFNEEVCDDCRFALKMSRQGQMARGKQRSYGKKAS